MKYKGFTLAEVLITLLIIGIVAALTIPSVISNYQQQEFKTGLKKAVSVLNEAIQVNIAQDGETPYENKNLFSYLQKHMSVLNTGYVHTFDNYFNIVFYTTDGIRYETNDEGNYSNIKMHETGLPFQSYKFSKQGNTGSGYCGSYGLNNNVHNTVQTPCLLIVDVNGNRKPNPPGLSKYSGSNNWADKNVVNAASAYFYPSPTDKKLTDIFTIMITDEKAIPFGVVAQRAMYSK